MKTRRRLPRPYKYLDAALAESYLSQLIDGIPEGGSTTERSGITEGGGYGLGLRGTGVRGGRETQEGTENQERFRYNPESVFSRLYEELNIETEEEDKILVQLDSLDKNSWDELCDGDIIEITGTMKIPDILKAFDIASKFRQMLPSLDQIGAWSGEEIPFGEKDRALLTGLGGFQEALASQEATVVIIEPIKTPEYRFVAKSRTECLRPSAGDIEGEAKVVGTVGRKVNKGDPR